MLTLLKLFGRSPFAPLQSHMEIVSRCVHQLPRLFEQLKNKDYVGLEQTAALISETEHQADIVKNDIRNNLSKSTLLPIDHSHLLDILSLQDSIADKTEDIAVLLTLKQIELLPEIESEFKLFLDKNIETFEGAHLIIKEMHELIETSFGGLEAQKVRGMVHDVATMEHEVDLIQHRLLKSLFKAEDKMTYTTFFQWQKLFEATAAISNLSENLAYRVRMTLELK